VALDHAVENVERKGDSRVRIDLQDIYRANPKAFIAASALIAAAFAFLVIKGVSGSGSSSPGAKRAATHSTTTTPSAGTTTAAAGVTTPDPSYHPAYATNVPSSPIDEKLASAMGQSGSAMAALEALTPPAPAWTTAYPAVPATVTQSDQGYAVAFTKELLNRDYRTQSRSDLARWLQAEAAAEMLPGVPAATAEHTLFGELMEPAAIGDQAGPVPTATQWTTLAGAGVKQHVYNVFVNPDPTWSGFVSQGFTSADPLLTVKDVTGVIATTRSGKTTTKHFSFQLFLASALHHPGYGSFGIDQWGAD
jgi:hypothetical protein